MYSMNHRGKQKYFGSTQGQLLRLPPPQLSQFRARDTSHLSVLTRGYSSFKLAMQTHYQTQMHRVSAHSMLVLNVDSHLASLALMCPSLSLSSYPKRTKTNNRQRALAPTAGSDAGSTCCLDQRAVSLCRIVSEAELLLAALLYLPNVTRQSISSREALGLRTGPHSASCSGKSARGCSLFSLSLRMCVYAIQLDKFI